MTIKSGARWYFRSHILQITAADRADETIGAILTLLPSVYSGSFTGSPAPETITSAPISTAFFTYAG